MQHKGGGAAAVCKLSARRTLIFRIGFRRRRLQVPRLRTRSSCFVRLAAKLRKVYDRFLASLGPAKSICAKKQYSSADAPRASTFARSNSFYAEAIADCLDFIKRSSAVAMDA